MTKRGDMSETQRLAKAACEIMYSDSLVRYDVSEIETAIDRDAAKNGRFITDKELEELCLGDEDGSVDAMATLFPELNGVLERPF